MKKLQRGYFFYKLYNKKKPFPLTGQIEITYRCNLNCIHCYCKGQEDKDRELTTQEWKNILDVLQKEGCLHLGLTGGDPLIRDDFLELYSYAKAKGFIITIFTNGQALTAKLINYLVKSPPISIEITLNGITEGTYEAITQIKGSFFKVMQTIKILKEKKLPLILKTNCLKQNKQEINRIKEFTEELFTSLPRNKYHFKYGSMIHPRYNRDKTPCNYRLSFKEILELRKQDPDICKQYKEDLECRFPRLKRNQNFLYHCNAWQQLFFINPYGYLKFCNLSDKFSVNLKTGSFREGFYEIFPKLLYEKFKTDSKCRNCRLRPICYNCPARAFLETGDEEAPVPYYCELAKATYDSMITAHSTLRRRRQKRKGAYRVAG